MEAKKIAISVLIGGLLTFGIVYYDNNRESVSDSEVKAYEKSGYDLAESKANMYIGKGLVGIIPNGFSYDKSSKKETMKKVAACSKNLFENVKNSGKTKAAIKITIEKNEECLKKAIENITVIENEIERLRLEKIEKS